MDALFEFRITILTPMKIANLFRLCVVALLLGLLANAGQNILAQSPPPTTPPSNPAPTPAASPTPAPAATAAPATTPGVLSIIPFDLVTLTVGLLSIAGVTLIIQGFLKNRAAVYMPPDTVAEIRNLISTGQHAKLLELTSQDPSFIAKVLYPAVKRAPSVTAMKESLETAVSEQTADSFRRIEYLNVIGNLGPLLGLLGTVLGMIQAFIGVQTAGGQANVATLSGGIATALAHTFLGLMLAVPCLACFGILRTIIDRLTVRSALLADDILIQLIESSSGSTNPPAASPAAPAGSTYTVTRSQPSIPPAPRPQV